MPGVPNYTDAKELNDLISGNDYNYLDRQFYQKFSNTNIGGIEGLPYQFLPTVDRRIDGTKNLAIAGRKYTEKIFSKLPLLFLTPCEPLFMDDFSKQDKIAGTDALLSRLRGDDVSELLTEPGRYYSTEFAYANYMKYLNTMLTSIAVYLNLYNQKIYFTARNSKGKNIMKLGEVNWGDELNPAYKTFFSAQENLIFYLDSLDSISESYGNSTAESSLASQINGFSDQAREIQFLFGKNGNAVADMIASGSEVTSSISQSLAGAASSIGGGIVGSLAEKGVNTVLNGGKIVFPEIWSGSTYDHSYSINFKFRSPDNDSLSIFLNVLKPYCKLLALVLPRIQQDAAGAYNANAYRSPFLVRAYSKGMFNVDMGLITSMSVTKGATAAWNDDGLPTQIDVSLEIADLYKSLAMSSSEPEDDEQRGILGGLSRINPIVSADNARKNLVANTAYMDFLANVSGLNVGQMMYNRRLKMYYYLTKSSTVRVPSTMYTHLEQSLSSTLGWLYNKTS